VQETMIRAWHSLDRFDGRSSLRTWMYRIATNVCLDALAARGRRERPMETGPAGHLGSELVERPRTHWLEPVPDARVLPAEADPTERAILRQSVRLAFVAALQHLPPRQRAALLMTEVLGWGAGEVAEALETSVAAVNSALQRARATVGSPTVAEAPAEALTPAQSRLLEQFVDAFERYDVEGLAGLLADDAILNMPPYDLWLQGPPVIAAWLAARGAGCRGSRLVPTAANGLPAWGQYRPGANGGPQRAFALTLLELDGDRIVSWTSFLDASPLFPLFGLPLEL
jgi:RNA polymerase sigma-70 factor (ECF subfamily)